MSDFNEGATQTILLYDFFGSLRCICRFLHEESDEEADSIFIKQADGMLREFEQHNFIGFDRSWEPKWDPPRSP